MAHWQMPLAESEMDLTGLSLVIGSVAVLVTSITASVVSVMTFLATQEIRVDVAEAKRDIKTVELATNSLTDRLVASTSKESHAAGVKEEKDRAEGAREETSRAATEAAAKDLGNG